jgi:hypothetical protein
MSGQSYGVIRPVQVTVTTEAAAYADGDSLHTTVITLTNALQKAKHSGEVVSVVVADKDEQSVALSLELFSRSPSSNTVVTKNVELDIADADLPYHIGSIPVAAADYKAFADNSVATVRNVGLAVRSDAVDGAEESRDLFLIVVSRGTPTYTSTSSIIVTLFIRQD